VRLAQVQIALAATTVRIDAFFSPLFAVESEIT
jgi:hypothetical protein